MITSANPPTEVMEEMRTLVAIYTFTCGSRARTNLQQRALVTFRKKTSAGQGPPFSSRSDLYRWLYENKRQTWKTYVILNPTASNPNQEANASPAQTLNQQQNIQPAEPTLGNVPSLDADNTHRETEITRVCFFGSNVFNGIKFLTSTHVSTSFRCFIKVNTAI
jgi:hypothetical protein